MRTFGSSNATCHITDEEILATAEAFNSGDIARAVSMVSDNSVRAFSLTGTPTDVIPQIEALIDAGRDQHRIRPAARPGFPRRARDAG